MGALGGLFLVIPLLGAPQGIAPETDATADDGSPVAVQEAPHAAEEARDGDAEPPAESTADGDAKPSQRPAAGRSEPAIEVQVVGQRPIAKDKTEDTTTVAGERLRESPRATVFEALSQEAGDVYVTSGGTGIHGVATGATGAIHIRGLGGSPNSQVLVVENGVPDYQGIFGHPLPDEFFPFLVDQVMMIKGGDSVLYGTNALGGAIVIRDRWRTRPGFELVSDSAAGSFGTVRQTVGALGETGPWDFGGAVHALKTEGHRDGAGGSNLIGQFGVRYHLSRVFNVTLREKLLHVTGGDPGPASHPYARHSFDVWRERVSLEANLGKGPLRLAVVPYLNVGRHELYDGFCSRDITAGGSAESTYRLHRDAELLVGAAGEWVDGNVENRVTNEPTPVQGMGSCSVYHQVTVRPVRPVSLVFGMRDLYSSRYGSIVLYKAGARWSLGKGFYLRSRASRSFRQPTLRELYLPYPTANPNLKPEIALTSDAGGGFLSDHFEASVTGYRTQARDLIKYFGVWPSAEVVNIDNIVIWGIEGRIALRELGPFDLSVTGNWQDVGRFTRQNPNAKLNFTLGAGHEMGAHFIGGSIGGEWVHGLYMADYGRQPIRDVFVMDAQVRYRHGLVERGITLEPYLLLRNLLDRRYAYVADYPMPGFNVMVGLKIGI